jgi:hypothetical protein
MMSDEQRVTKIDFGGLDRQSKLALISFEFLNVM